MNLKPLRGQLIIKAIAEEETAAELVASGTAKEKPQRGKVLAVGDSAPDADRKQVRLDVSAGDEILYSKYGGTEITVAGEDLLVLREADVLSKVAPHSEQATTEPQRPLSAKAAARAVILANAREELPSLTKQADAGIARLRRVADR